MKHRNSLKTLPGGARRATTFATAAFLILGSVAAAFSEHGLPEVGPAYACLASLTVGALLAARLTGHPLLGWPAVAVSLAVLVLVPGCTAFGTVEWLVSNVRGQAMDLPVPAVAGFCATCMGCAWETMTRPATGGGRYSTVSVAIATVGALAGTAVLATGGLHVPNALATAALVTYLFAILGSRW